MPTSLKKTHNACISLISLVFVFSSMVYFNSRVDKYFYTKSPLSTPLEYILRTVGHSNTSKMLYCPHNIYMIPNYHGPFPVDYHFVLKPTDVIFDTSPAGYQPWRAHRKNLPFYYTFKFTDVTKYSLETINKTIHQKDIDHLKSHFKSLLLHNSKTIKFAEKGERFIFLCNIPRCVTHLIMALAFMDMYAMDFTRPCHITEYKPHYLERYLAFDEPNKKSSYQYLEWSTSSLKYNYDPNFFEDEDLHYGQSYTKHMFAQESDKQKMVYNFQKEIPEKVDWNE